MVDVQNAFHILLAHDQTPLHRLERIINTGYTKIYTQDKLKIHAEQVNPKSFPQK